ncbi:hypothetical protein ACSLBF_08325 [Pseudoalteromonas sp. T1lg65]|uniref:hypothetical protein n=1 Tax=Pseudoalteromonas sp. T1lg65 TaxID=2077101 RepID=UPI003F79BDD5
MIARNVFYHATFNYGGATSQSKFVWGVKNFDMSKGLKEQILDNVGEFDVDLIFNFQITAFNNISIEDTDLKLTDAIKTL